ncbi:hypothetical protein [Marinobacterium aestuariivivens]|uniref:FecR protein domain-containing protein n=1 Tax=Marinobacterium aestuariivivens TaxID=1698799 RepID=A0ABW2A421_9GAMM
MSNPIRLPALVGLLLFALYAALFAGGANADPSGRVGHLSDSYGQVSYSPSGEDQWLSVVRNRPLIRGDRLWTDRDARAEFQVGSSAVRIDANSSLEILDLNDRIVQLQLTQGALSLSVRRQYRDQQVEIATPCWHSSSAAAVAIGSTSIRDTETPPLWCGKAGAKSTAKTPTSACARAIRCVSTTRICTTTSCTACPVRTILTATVWTGTGVSSAPSLCAMSTTIWPATAIWMNTAVGAP